MSGTTPVATQGPAPRSTFAVTAHNLCAEAFNASKSYKLPGLTLEECEQVLGLDLCIRSALKQLAKVNIKDHTEELDHLVSGRVTIIQNFFPLEQGSFSISPFLQQMANAILRDTSASPQKMLEDLIEKIPKAKKYVKLIHEELAALLGTTRTQNSQTAPIGEARTAAERGKELFEGGTEDRGTIAQALFNVAHQHDVLTKTDLESREQLYIRIAKADRLFKEKAADLFKEPEVTGFDMLTETEVFESALAQETTGLSVATAQARLARLGLEEEIGKDKPVIKTEVQTPETPVTTSVKAEVQTPQTPLITPDKTEVLTLETPVTTPVKTRIQPPKTQETTSVKTEVLVTQIQVTTPVSVQTETQQPTETQEAETIFLEEQLKEAVAGLIEERQANSKLLFPPHVPSTISTAELAAVLQEAENQLTGVDQTPASTQREKLEGEAAIRHMEVTDLQAQFEKVQDKIQEIHKSIETEEGLRIALSQRYELLQENVKNLRKEEQDKRVQAERCKNQAAKIQVRLETINKDLLGKTAKMEGLTNQAKDAEARVKACENETVPPELSKEAQDVVSLIRETDKSIKELEKNRKNAEAELLASQQVLAEAEKLVKAAKDAADDAEVEMLGLPMQITEAEQRIKQAQQEHNKLIEEAGVKDKALLKAKDEHEKTTQRLTGMSTPIVGAKQEWTPKQIKENVMKILQELLKPTFYRLEPESASIYVMEKIAGLPHDTQEKIKEHVYVNSKDPTKTRENEEWINAHIGDEIDLIWAALEEAAK